jgi:hypothetical protein
VQKLLSEKIKNRGMIMKCHHIVQFVLLLAGCIASLAGGPGMENESAIPGKTYTLISRDK